MKKVLIIIAIIAIIIGFFKAKQWWIDKQNLEAEKDRELLRLKEHIQEDSTTISRQALVIDDAKKVIGVQSDNIKDLRNKYNSKADSFIKLQVKFDSLKASSDTVFIEPDSSKPGAYIFKQDVGNGYFEIGGYAECNPFNIYNLYCYQTKSFVIEAAIDRTGNDEYVSYIHYEPSFLHVNSSTIKVLDKRRWINYIFFGASVSAIRFGAGISLYYKNYGVGWMQFTDGNALMFHYLKNLGEIF